MNVRWLRQATKSLRAIHAHIAVENPQAARRVVRAIRAASLRLRGFPLSGRPGTLPETRELIVVGVPYLIVYTIVGETVFVIRVFHTASNWPQEVAGAG